MYSIMIAFGAHVWNLAYKTKEPAEKAFAQLQHDGGRTIAGVKEPKEIVLTDDYGQTIRIDLASVTGVLIEDMNATAEAHIDRALLQQRTQVRAQKKMQNDPGLALMNTPAAFGHPAANGRRL